MSSEWLAYNEPCPHCGGLDFLEKATQMNIVKLSKEESEDDEVHFIDNEYTIEDIIVDDTDIQEVWCRGCDKQVL